MKKGLFLLIVFLPFSFIGNAQVIEYARTVVNTLGSEEFKGRGYVDGGDKLAADYIRQEFEKHNLKSFTKNYFQSFKTPVNTFPNKITLKINGKNLQAGSDFLVEAGSPKVKGVFEVISISAEDLLTDERLIPKLQQSSGKFQIIEPFNKEDFTKEELDRINGVTGFLKYHENNPAEGTIILTMEKLTWSGSTTEFPNPGITIHADSISGPIKHIEIDLKNKFHKNYKTQNVIGFVEGENSDSAIVFIAHYDHLGMLGPDAVFTGANDNASGVAMLLSLAKFYAENNPKYSTVFIAFGAEELGLVGSRYFTENPLFDLSTIKFLINFDISGTGDDGIQVVNGSVYKDEFDLLTELNKKHQLLPQIKIRGEACNSDHCMFDRQNVPNFYIYTLGGISAYHDIYDRPETLPLTEFEDYFTLITRFIEKL
ncbi:MAG: M28 family peptidase [Balneolaceae bacterium]